VAKNGNSSAENSLAALITALDAGHSLTGGETAAAAAALASTQEPEDSKARFLEALASKGETASEIAGFALAFRERALDPGLAEWAPRAIDVVGTGGDHSGGFNVSTVTTMVLACLGVPAIKHGNRGITSKCGSADIFGALGVDLQASPERLRRAMAELGFVFLFAPAWHPAFKAITPVRRALAERGRRTIFNILGPLLNPARPAHALIGAATVPLVEKLAGALDALGAVSGLAVHGILGPGQGIDELTTATTNVVRGAGRLREISAEWLPDEFGLVPAPFSDLAGGTLEENLALLEALASGGGPRGLADTIALNAAAALWITGARPDVRAGLGAARETLLGGALRDKIAATRDFFSA